MRISTTQFYEVSTQNYQRSYANVVKTGEEVSSGIKLNTSSDDPVGAARVLQLAQQNSMLTQYKSNISVINTNTSNSETALDSIISSMQAARELIVKGGNGSYTEADRISTAGELKQLQSQILGLMNTQDSNGQYIFSGSKSSTPPYMLNSDGTYSYAGDQTTIDLAVGDGLKLPSNVTGFEAFEKSAGSVRTSSTLTSGPSDGKVALSGGFLKSINSYNDAFQGGEPYSISFTSGTQFKITDKGGNDVTSQASTAGVFDYSKSDTQSFTFRGIEMNLNINLSATDKASPAAATAALTVPTRTYTVASTLDSITTSRSPGNVSSTTISKSEIGSSAADKTAFNNTFPNSGATLRYSGTNGYELYASPYAVGNTPVATGAAVATSTLVSAGANKFTVPGTPADGDTFNDPTNPAVTLRYSSTDGYELYNAPYNTGDTRVGTGTISGAVVKAAGVEFTMAGNPPADGDVYTVQAGNHQTQNVLNTLSAAIKAMSTPSNGDVTVAQGINAALTAALGNITNNIETASTARSIGGANLVAADAQGTTNELLMGNNELESGKIVNSDLVEATTRLTLQQTMLQASQTVFTQLSKLNLFSQL
ncbi:flagellar hook-associated protein 3 [Pseudomonas syringae]|uniref:Flagellar hook protein FlgL n=1 Tax=Pseudomonas syringae TaxID=317 RepID=A0A085VQV4_PSESX|nr:flagellar hook-associated protein 3 [Pseudomonas syringae]KFE57817.1 flagellar hook protein FlgL [Pseudomonas syringae]